MSVCSASIVVCLTLAGCGKKGPPLPPLVRIPAPPEGFVAERRGDHVEVQFTVPAANTDRSKPANLERVDVYGFTGADAVSDDDLLKYGTLVGSVDVKAPRDPDAAEDPDEAESEADVEDPTGAGLDQGAHAAVEEKISPAAFAPGAVRTRERGKEQDQGRRPLIGPPVGAPSRTYVAVGITTRGRKGAPSKRAAVPLVPPPPAPSQPQVTFTEKEIAVGWTSGAAAPDGVLPSRPLGAPAPSSGYHVYEVPAPSAKPDAKAARLTKAPVDALTFADTRVNWGAERCYVVRAVETIAGTAIESEPSPEKCVTLTDTFPPAPPKGLTAVAGEGAISLIWDANTEADLAGYVVLRGTAPGDAMAPVTPAPIAETTFKDNVQAGIRYVYAVQAVDKSGNISATSARVEETAR